ncbi:MAG: hypothetical protein ACR2LJ_07195 [Acidimicrobiales bacterium]
MGTYQPLGFVVAGLASRGAGGGATVLRRARLGDVGLWLALAAAAAVLCDGRHPACPCSAWWWR